jgi:hypothetical protein
MYKDLRNIKKFTFHMNCKHCGKSTTHILWRSVICDVLLRLYDVAFAIGKLWQILVRYIWLKIVYRWHNIKFKTLIAVTFISIPILGVHSLYSSIRIPNWQSNTGHFCWQIVVAFLLTNCGCISKSLFFSSPRAITS